MRVPEPRFEAKKSRSVRLGRKIATGVAACALAAGVIGVAAGAANASKVKSRAQRHADDERLHVLGGRHEPGYRRLREGQPERHRAGRAS